MKYTFFQYYSLFILITVIGFGCTPEPKMEINELSQVQPIQGTKATITITLPENDWVNSRMSYEEINLNGGKAIQCLWSEDDKLVENSHPSTEDSHNVFTLVSGEGTSTGTFVCNNFSNNYSKVRKIYYPASKIKRDVDFLNISYADQTQKGDNNLKHLKDYYSFRLDCATNVLTQIYPMLDFQYSEGRLEQSSCMKFVLSGFPEMIPVEVSLEYFKADGSEGKPFHEYNYLDRYYGSYIDVVHPETTNRLSLNLSEFHEKTTTLTAYMMMSNYTIEIEKDAIFRVTVTSQEGKKYYADKLITANGVLDGGCLHIITLSEGWQGGTSDVFDQSNGGVYVIQEATKGTGTDIIIMGDGFTDEEIKEGTYEAIMKQAADNFFSVEPYITLKEYFNVYYVNAASLDKHDAKPFIEETMWYTNKNGASNGTARTIFETKFRPGQTHIEGNDNVVMRYMLEAIRRKGSNGGTPCTDEEEIYKRAESALAIVMINVECYAGTCYIYWNPWDYYDDYANPHSIAYIPLGYDGTGEQCKWTTIHEAGGHGFGKLGDEYGDDQIIFNFNYESFSQNQESGLYKNVDIYWTAELEEKYGDWADYIDSPSEYTTINTIGWADMLSAEHTYVQTEGLNMYEGAFTYPTFFCRSTPNSIMRSHLEANGHFFNAPSRRAIYYRLMKKTGGGDDWYNFESCFTDFFQWDPCRNIKLNWEETSTRSTCVEREEELLPLAPPVIKEMPMKKTFEPELQN